MGSDLYLYPRKPRYFGVWRETGLDALLLQDMSQFFTAKKTGSFGANVEAIFY
jgi:hypothetical protein